MEISLIAADWGTSNRRAFALDGAGRVMAEKSDGQGMLALQPSEFDASFRAFAGDWLTGRPPVLICGMAGSRMGWIEAPYLACPADPKGLARVLTRAPSELSVHIVPGVSFDGAGEPDVMRGEETKVLGLGLDHGVVLSPGTHPKWIFLEGGRIAHFRTYMTGEMFNTLQGAGTLAQLMAPMVPHLAEDIWARMGGEGLVAQAPWPQADPAMLVRDTVILPIQINGKRRSEQVVECGTQLKAGDLTAFARAQCGAQLEEVLLHLIILLPQHLKKQ
jgi:2-keto-3-deoxy-galactonokinase